MPFAAAAILAVLAVAVAAPALALGAVALLAGRPRRLDLRDPQPSIQTFLMLAVLAVVAVALAFAVPFAVAFASLPHGFTAVEGLFLAALTVLGVAYAWRRGALRWQ